MLSLPMSKKTDMDKEFMNQNIMGTLTLGIMGFMEPMLGTVPKQKL